jgi:SAM-dependent methyltransferase
MPAVNVPFELLVCPVCQGSLRSEADTLRCEGCGRAYPEPDGVPDLTPVPPPDDAVVARWGLWEELQRNGADEYAAAPVASLSVGEREEPAAFGRFSELCGRVLDVGCGPQTLPSYAASFDGVLVGVDPLLGERRRQFHFVQGIAEYLPFPDRSFDRVLFATSLDHVLSPQLALTEARRVTKQDGAVLVWLGEIIQPPSVSDRLQTAAGLLRAGDLRAVGARVAAMTRQGLTRRTDVEAELVAPRRAVPEGAVDAFHFAHPDEASVREWLRHAGLTVVESERPFPNSCFLRSVPAV